MAEIICSQNCDNQLPVVSFNDCAPEINLSEVEFVILGNPNTDPIANVSDTSEWAARLDNADEASPHSLRLIRVIGDKPAPTDQEQTISGARVITVDRTHVVNADIDETNDVNWDAARQLQCGGQKKAWYVTRSGHVFGGNAGIEASVKINEILNRGENEIQRLQMVLTWKSKIMPQRDLWPLYGMATYGGAPIGE